MPEKDDLQKRVINPTESALTAIAINTAAAVRQLRDTVVGLWDLKETDGNAPENAVHHSYSNGQIEDIVNRVDGRVLVDEKDYMPGGKYRSIVKLFLRYDKQKPEDPWAMATGWLIKDDLMVTAGHCAFDWSHNLGRLTHIKAYIGYSGKGSIGDPNVQFRKGKRVVTTSEWLTSRGSKPHDVSFIQLQQPFTKVQPIKFAETPRLGDLVLGVVGYPGDKQDGNGEFGARMYQMFRGTPYNLEESRDRMLEYKIDTFGGNSGSPVFRQSDKASIGVHVYGGDVNSASVIGPYGNNFENCLATFNIPSGNAISVAGLPGLSIVRVPPTRAPAVLRRGAVNGGANGHRGGVGENALEAGEGFFDDFVGTLKSAVKVAAPIASNVLQAGLPILFGPIGAPVGALAGIALRAAGKAAESEVAVESFSADVTKAGLVERAILGEAAIAGITSMSKSTLDEEGLFSVMTDIMKKHGPVVRRVAPKVIKVVAEPALRVALDALNENNKSENEFTISPHLSQPDFHSALAGASMKGVGRDTLAFVEALLESSPGTESAWANFASIDATLGGIVINAIAPPKGANTILSSGLSTLAASSTEAGFGGNISSTISFDGLPQRAMLGEAALQAIMRVPVHKLKEEGIFDVMKEVIKKFGPTVIQAAPAVINAVHPLVGSILGAGGEAILTVPEKPRVIRKVKSNIGNDPNDFLGAAKDWAKNGAT